MFNRFKRAGLSKAKCALLLLASNVVSTAGQASNSTSPEHHYKFNASTGNIIALTAVCLVALSICSGVAHFARTYCKDRSTSEDDGVDIGANPRSYKSMA